MLVSGMIKKQRIQLARKRRPNVWPSLDGPVCLGGYLEGRERERPQWWVRNETMRPYWKISKFSGRFFSVGQTKSARGLDNS